MCGPFLRGLPSHRTMTDALAFSSAAAMGLAGVMCRAASRLIDQPACPVKAMNAPVAARTSLGSEYLARGRVAWDLS